MLIISIRDNENNRWKRNAKAKKQKKKTTATKKKQRQKRTWGAEAIVKGWELNDFPVQLS